MESPIENENIPADQEIQPKSFRRTIAREVFLFVIVLVGGAGYLTGLERGQEEHRNRPYSQSS